MAKPATAKPKSVEQARDIYLASKRIRYADSCHNDRWSVVLETNHTRTDVLTPRFWTAMSGKFKPGDIIDIRRDDESIYGEFYVIEADRLGARLQEFRWIEIGGAGKGVAIDRSEYVYAWKGSQLKHCVLRADDNEIVMKEFQSKDAALVWIAGREKAA